MLVIVVLVFLSGFGGFLLGNQHGHYRRLSPLLPWYLGTTLPRPVTIVGWCHRQLRLIWHRKSLAGPRSGRPPTLDYVEDWILTLHRNNRGYSARRIAAILRHDLKHPIDKNTVARILKKHGLTPHPPDTTTSRHQDPDWRTLFHNHAFYSMVFKTTLDALCRQVFILNIVDHKRRRLVWSRATHNPTSAWVAQQIREAFPFDEARGGIMLMDRDSIFAHIAAHTLPSFGMRVRRTAYRCPWQNAVVERFNRTLKEELLSSIVVLNLRQLNRLLSEYRTYYNTARPHMANDGEPPMPIDPVAANDSDIGHNPSRCRLEAIPWLGGLHHSYRLSA